MTYTNIEDYIRDYSNLYKIDWIQYTFLSNTYYEANLGNGIVLEIEEHIGFSNDIILRILISGGNKVYRDFKLPDFKTSKLKWNTVDDEIMWYGYKNKNKKE